MTRIKICGITRVEDALAAASAGADAIGLVFYASSPRAVTIKEAQAICQALPPFITTVGLFVNASSERIQQILKVLSLDLLQFHGEETANFCQQFHKPWLKALRVRPEEDAAMQISQYPHAQGILLDSYVEGMQGGTGETFNWSLIPEHRTKPIILAGGLTPENVTEAVRQVKPYAVDVSGGVEDEKGIKNHKKIEDFIKAVRNSLQ